MQGVAHMGIVSITTASVVSAVAAVGVGVGYGIQKLRGEYDENTKEEEWPPKE